MRATIFRPSRNGTKAKNWVARIYVRPGEKPKQVPLHVSMKETAQKKTRELLLNMEKEEAGLILPAHQREAAKRGLIGHLDDYLHNLEQLGRKGQYIKQREKQLLRIFRECSWKVAADIARDSFERWLCKLEVVAKTRNDYLIAAKSFATWLLKQQRLVVNPLAGIEMAKVKGNESGDRRAYTDDELERLFAVAGPRTIVYQTAVYTGLRRKELIRLQWRDLQLEGDSPSFRARAAKAKNGKDITLPLVHELARRLSQFKPGSSRPTDYVFAGLLGMKMAPLEKDLTAAKIPLLDANEEKANFHSFRHTCATKLVRSGAPRREVMEFMRLSEDRLLDKVYTDVRHLPLVATISGLHFIDKNDAPYYAPTPVRVCPEVSVPVSLPMVAAILQKTDVEPIVPLCPRVSPSVRGGEMVRDTGFEPVTPTMSR